MKAGWQYMQLCAVCTLQRGFDLPTKNRIPGKFPLVSSSGIIDTHCIGPIKGPGVVTGRSGSIGGIFFVEDDFWPLNTTLYVRDFHGNAVRFVYHLLNHFDLKRFAGGTGVPTLNRNDVHGVMVSIPFSIDEQQRIVSILDEAFEGIATAKTNAEKNLQNARALFESHLQSVFSQRGEGWVETTVGDQLMLQRGFDITKNQQREGKVPVVSSGGIKSSHDTAMVKAPGVVIGRKGTLGKVFFLDSDFWPHDTTLWVKDFKGNESRFVFYLLTGLDLKKLDSGTANPALNRNQVHPLKIYWPSVEKQQDIALRLDSLAEETQRLESVYKKKLAAFDALKKSLLDQAFTGQL